MNLDGSTCRCPALHRAIVGHWHLRAPANDSELIPRDRPGKGRHPDLADVVPALRAWRDLHSPSVPLTTNWLASAANDNAAEEPFDAYEDEWRETLPAPSVDSQMEMRPRPEELVRAMGDVEIAHSEFGGPAVPVGGDMDVHPGMEPAVIGGTPCAPLARMGALRFGNGETHERGMVRAAGGVIRAGEIPVPRGALTHCGPFAVRDRHTSWHGSVDGKIDPASASPSISIEDRIDAERLAGRLRQQLGANDVAVLDTALEAQNLADIGELVGLTGKHAQREGKVMLRAAAERLREMLQAA
ncbi:hypothetical protein EV667_1336 [Ancylobacter aquaticus]|uniref:Uncharacterized protein n=1 Tax=Ancylobacter aquaticus TaxID=100 RepID=A0A4R1IBW8_ANCAQ|nr:hypothetical protein [Ancylobacter aquaticus]TCK31230.1 hypothetical protein EV667_1336 [Ancylobacter aquaticus]